MRCDEFLHYVITWFLAAASSDANPGVDRDSKEAPLAGVRALQMLWANKGQIPEGPFDPGLPFCYDPGAKALWLKTTALGRLASSLGLSGDIARQFTAGKPISIATLKFRKTAVARLWTPEKPLDLRDLVDPTIREWMRGFPGLRFTPIRHQGNIAIAYKPRRRWRWVGIRRAEDIDARAPYPESDNPAWHKECLRLFPTVSVISKRREAAAVPAILPFPNVQPLPWLNPTSGGDVAPKVFRSFERHPREFEGFCQELLATLLRVPEDESRKRSDATRTQVYIGELAPDDELRPTSIKSHAFDQIFPLVEIPASKNEDGHSQPGRIASLHLRYIADRSEAVDAVMAGLFANNRLAACLDEDPSCLVITSNLDEALLTDILSEHRNDQLRRFSGRVLLLGRTRIVDAVHSHYGMHRAAIGHHLDGRLLANPFMELPIGTRVADNPGTLLQAKFGLVRFDREIRAEAGARLHAWLAEETPMGVMLVEGPGGAGKTRLVSEFLRENAREWKTGLIHEHALPKDLPILAHTREPLLCVLDYGETTPEKLLPLLRETVRSERGLGHPLKLLVTARRAGAWWRRLEEDEYVGGVVSSWEPVNLSAAALDIEARRRLYRRAIVDYSRTVAVGRPSPRQMPTLEEPHFARPLYVLMAALLAVYESRDESADAATIGDQELLEAILKHERRYWDEAIERFETEPSIPELLRACIERVIVAVALVGGTENEASTIALIDRVAPECRAARKDLPRLLSGVLWRLYPGRKAARDSDRPIDAIQPDLLADHLIDTRGDAVLLDHLTQTQTISELEDVFRTLNRGAMDFPKIMVLLERLLERWIRKEPEELLTIAGRTGKPMTDLLATTLAKTGDVGLAELYGDRCPPHDLDLLEIGAVAVGISLHHTKHREIEPTEAEHDQIAGLANKLSIRVSGLGRDEEALALAEEAVTIRRTLATIHPDIYRPGLATALHTLGKRQADQGHDKEALASAEEAVEIRRGLAKIDPDTSLPKLATELGGLGAVLYKLRRHDESHAITQEALAIRRQLAERDPANYRPRLATTLNNSGANLSHLGRNEEALAMTKEACKIWEELAEKDPDIFEPKVGATLNNMARQLALLGRLGEAITTARRAVAIFNELAARYPHIFNPDRGTALGTLGDILIRQGQYENAKQVLRSAIDAVLPSYRRHPATFSTRMQTPLQDYTRVRKELDLPHAPKDLAKELGLTRDETISLLHGAASESSNSAE